MWRFYSVLVGILLLLAACDSTHTTQDSLFVLQNAVPDYVSDLRGAVLDPPRALDDFSIMSTTGTEFVLNDHRGEILLLYFGYRACPDFCPTTFAELRRVYNELGEPSDRVKIVFVTVDAERDTLDILGLYTNAFHEDFIGLRPEGEVLGNLMTQFGVVAEKRIVGESALSYLYDHTATLFLINAEGELAVQYLYGTPYTSIVHDVRLMLDAETQ